MAQYGKIGVITYFAIFFATWGGFAAAIAAGVQVESTAGGAGLLGASYLATKVTQPLRIAATFALTPILAAVWQRLAPKRKK